MTKLLVMSPETRRDNLARATDPAERVELTTGPVAHSFNHTLTERKCECGRPDCPGFFTGPNYQIYANAECREYVKKARNRIRAADSRKNGTDTISKRKASGEVHLPSSEGVKDGNKRKPSASWPERFESIRAKYGVKLPKPGEYTI